MSVAGVEIDISSEVVRQLQADTAIASVQVPVRNRGGTKQGAGVDAPIPTADFQPIKPSPGTNSSVARLSPQRSVHGIDFLMSIPAPHVHVALKVAQPDGSVPSVQIHAAFFRHVNGNIYAPVVAAEVKMDYVLRKTHFQ